MLSTASVDDLNRRLEDEYEDPPYAKAIQFRPNIEIEGPVPYAEVIILHYTTPLLDHVSIT